MPFSNDKQMGDSWVDKSGSDPKKNGSPNIDEYQTKDKGETKTITKTNDDSISCISSEYLERGASNLNEEREQLDSLDESFKHVAVASGTGTDSQSITQSSSMEVCDNCYSKIMYSDVELASVNRMDYSCHMQSSSLEIVDDYYSKDLRSACVEPHARNMSRNLPRGRRSRTRLQSQLSYPQARSLSVEHKRVRRMAPRVTPRLRVSRSRIDSLIPEPTVPVPVEQEEDDEKKKDEEIGWVYVPLGFWSLPRRQKLILFSLGLIDLTLYMCLSILAPFFPAEATKRGVSGTLSGWVFGCFALTQFISSPIFGHFLPKFGSRFMVLAGHFLAGGCTVLFGFLDYMPYDDGDGMMFVLFCFLVRIVLAIGCTMSATASFAIMVETFPDNVATVFGVLETFTGVGLMIGPALGGVLYEAGGFMLPFVSLGVVMILSVPVNMCILPYQAVDDSSDGSNMGSMSQLLCIPAVMVVCVATIIGALIWAILDPTLAPHLDYYSMTPAEIGSVFLLMSLFYAVSSPFWGWIADKVADSTPMMVLGFTFSGVGLLLLGPSTLIGFLPGYRKLWLDLIALIILGMSVSLAVIPTFEKILDAAEKAGIEDNIAMYSQVAGLWGGAYALGDFIGPSVGGFVVEVIGFDWCMTWTAGSCFLIAIILLILWIYEKKNGPTPCLIAVHTSETDLTPPERRPLLEPIRNTDTTTTNQSEPESRLADDRVINYGTAINSGRRSVELRHSEQSTDYERVTQSV